jgi:hypothetical protein
MAFLLFGILPGLLLFPPARLFRRSVCRFPGRFFRIFLDRFLTDCFLCHASPWL